MHFIIAYDVTSPSRLQRLHKALCEYALPIQKSVFLLRGSEAQFAKCRQKAEQIIDSSKDDLRFYALPERGIKIALGQAPLPDGIYLSEFPELSQSC